MSDMRVQTAIRTLFVTLAACSSSSGGESKLLFSDGFDTYPSTHWVQVCTAAPTLDSAVGSAAPSLALGASDTCIQTALVGPFPTPSTTFSMDMSIDSITSSGRACIMLQAQGNGSVNFGLDLEAAGGNFYDGLGGGCTLNNSGGLVSTAIAGFHTIALEFDASGNATARLDGSQIGTGTFNQDAVVMLIDGQSVHLDNVQITTP